MELLLIYITHGLLALASLVLLVRLSARVGNGAALYCGVATLFFLIVYGPMLSAGIYFGLDIPALGGMTVAVFSLTAFALIAAIALGVHGLGKQPDQEQPRAAQRSWMIALILALLAFCAHLGSWWLASSRAMGRMDQAIEQMSQLSVSLAPPSLKSGEDARPVYTAAIKLLPADLKRPDNEDLLVLHSKDQEVVDLDSKEVREYVKAVEPALDAGGAAVSKEALSLEYDFTRPSFFWISDFRDNQTLMRGWGLRSIIRARKGDADGAVKDLASVAALARHLEADPTMIGQIQSIAVRSYAIAALERVMQEIELTDDHWSRLQLSRRGAPRAMMQKAYRMERAIGVTTMAKVARGEIDVESIGEADEPGPTRMLFYRVFLGDNDVQQYGRIMDAYGKALQKPMDQWTDAMDNVVTDQQIHRSGHLTRMILPAMGRVSTMVMQCETRCRLAETAFALKRYKQENGSYPETLEQLQPKFLKAIPVDPFSGQSLLYLNKQGRTVVYSVGEDGLDDDAAPLSLNSHPRNGDVIFLLTPLKPVKKTAPDHTELNPDE